MNDWRSSFVPWTFDGRERGSYGSGTTNHPWAAGTVLKRVVAINGVPLPKMRMICRRGFRRLFGRSKL